MVSSRVCPGDSDQGVRADQQKDVGTDCKGVDRRLAVVWQDACQTIIHQVHSLFGRQVPSADPQSETLLIGNDTALAHGV